MMLKLSAAVSELFAAATSELLGLAYPLKVAATLESML